MKRKIVIALATYMVVFLSVSAYLIYTTNTATTNLSRLITLHQVEILREHYLLQIKKVQSDLTLMGTAHARDFDTVVSHVNNMGRIIDACSGCHHSSRGKDRLSGLRAQTEKYKDSLSRVLTIRANAKRYLVEENVAFQNGEELITKVQDMIAITNTSLGERTQRAMNQIERTRYILYTLIALGPFLSVVLAYFFLSGLTRPVNVLVESTRKLKGGDLDHRVAGLKDEFGELGNSFNEMAGFLKEEIQQMERTERDLARANQELKLAQEQMVRSETMAAVGTLSSGISHELTTPLSVILNLTQLTRQDHPGDPSLQKDLEVIEFEANQAIKITRSLLGFARSTRSLKDTVNLNEVLEDLFKILEYQPQARAVRMVRELAPDLSPIHASGGQMRQVFLNIILNAVQAMPGGGTLSVATRNCTEPTSEGVEVTVADTGVGIPKEQTEKIFQRFFTTKEEGTGLGLAIAHGIIQEHQGRIEVESKVGEGTTFRIFLPLIGEGLA